MRKVIQLEVETTLPNKALAKKSLWAILVQSNIVSEVLQVKVNAITKSHSRRTGATNNT